MALGRVARGVALCFAPACWGILGESLYDRDDGRDAGESLSGCNLIAIWTCGAASVVASVAAMSWAVEAGAAAGGGHDYTKVTPELSLLNCGPSADLPSASLMCLSCGIELSFMQPIHTSDLTDTVPSCRRALAVSLWRMDDRTVRHLAAARALLEESETLYEKIAQYQTEDLLSTDDAIAQRHARLVLGKERVKEISRLEVARRLKENKEEARRLLAQGNESLRVRVATAKRVAAAARRTFDEQINKEEARQAAAHVSVAAQQQQPPRSRPRRWASASDAAAEASPAPAAADQVAASAEGEQAPAAAKSAAPPPVMDAAAVAAAAAELARLRRQLHGAQTELRGLRERSRAVEGVVMSVIPMPRGAAAAGPTPGTCMSRPTK